MHVCKKFNITKPNKKNILAQDTDTAPDITIYETHLKVVETSTYLGFTITISLALDIETSIRIRKVAAAMYKLNKCAWNNNQMTTNIKVRVYQACIEAKPGPHTPTITRGSTDPTYAILEASFRSSGRTR
ncbi:hypothetical protein ElyMa_004030400 [Elysia marginata]|uniref:Uncharacterized protein n=1 Tax=Elysia marginata TaxID=1093978 RepID=A0AAV4G2S3_9GAST|nr:hypothetical protein ElyMa_004030400 [Elysia marginata]